MPKISFVEGTKCKQKKRERKELKLELFENELKVVVGQKDRLDLLNFADETADKFGF